VSLHRPGHLDAVAIFRCEKIRTDEKQDGIGALKLDTDSLIDGISRQQPPVMPGFDHSLPFEHREMNLELIAQLLILVAIGKEHDAHMGLSGWHSGIFSIAPKIMFSRRCRYPPCRCSM
jgi:hypothetical protein